MANFLDKTGLSYFWTKVKSYVDSNAAAKPKAITVTLSSSGWSSNSQTVSAPGVTTSNSVICAPTPANISAAMEAGVYCSSQSTNSLTFACSVAPSVNITYNILIQEVE